MKRLLWYARQLLPLTYRTYYADANGIHFGVWRMWFGHCFAVTDVILDPFSNQGNPAVQRLLDYIAHLACTDCPNRQMCEQGKFEPLDDAENGMSESGDSPA